MYSFLFSDYNSFVADFLLKLSWHASSEAKPRVLNDSPVDSKGFPKTSEVEFWRFYETPRRIPLAVYCQVRTYRYS